ncbi:DNA-directed RNA polymerase subunit omega [Rickettsiales bacterium LUAb2]
MARVTVEDCLKKINNHFELILVASVRAKEILNGKAPAIDRENSSVSVVVLREIAEEAINVDTIKDKLLTEFNNKNNLNIKHYNNDNDDNEEDLNDKVILEDDAKGLLIIDDINDNKLID